MLQKWLVAAESLTTSIWEVLTPRETLLHTESLELHHPHTLEPLPHPSDIWISEQQLGKLQPPQTTTHTHKQPELETKTFFEDFSEQGLKLFSFLENKADGKC